MKVAYLLGSLNRGGTEMLILDLFINSNEAPYEMVGLYRKDGILSRDFQSSETLVIKNKTGPFWMILLYLYRLRNLINSLQVDIIHVNQSIDTLYSFLACIGLPVKIIQTNHEYDFHYKFFEKFLKSLSLKLADHNLFVSKTLYNYYKSSYAFKDNGNNAVLYNAIDFKKFHKSPSFELKTMLGLQNDVLTLGMTGNFGPGHDQATVCRFLKLLDKLNVNFVFVFIGGKDNNNPLLYEECTLFCSKNNLNEKVHFLGTRSDVPDILTQLDAFIYSSTHDAFGISVIEAIASGIPVFVNDWEVMKEITDCGERAIIYRSKDENDLLKKFMDFYHCPENFKEIKALTSINKNQHEF